MVANKKFVSKRQVEVRLLLEKELHNIPFHEDCRPGWLTSSIGWPLELDFYVPALNLAIEVQGAQHARYVERFHGTTEKFQLQLRRDRHKRAVCEGQGLVLLEVWDADGVNALRDFIRKRVTAWDIVLSRRATQRPIRKKPTRRGQRKPYYLHVDGKTLLVRHCAFKWAVQNCKADRQDEYNAIARPGFTVTHYEMPDGYQVIQWRRVVENEQEEPTPATPQARREKV